MRKIYSALSLTTVLFLSGCMQKGSNPVDPYEKVNRAVHSFNMTFDNVVLRPPTMVYVSLVPVPVRRSVNNFFNNIAMIPTVANDILQVDPRQTLKDSWRFFINSTIGVAGLFDVATGFGLPMHSNDLGLTFAKWGDTHSPYIVIPFIGPSTIRDGVGLGIEYAAFSPYSWFVSNGILLYGAVGLRSLDLRSNYLDTEKLLYEALDDYAFLRDAFLQHRQYQITGVEVSQAPGEDGSSAAALGDDYIDD